MQTLDFRDLFVRNEFASQSAGQSLQASHQIEKFADILLTECSHPRAAIRQKIDKAFRGENFQCFAQRRSRDAKQFAELTLWDSCTLRERTNHDIVAQLAENFAVKSCRWRFDHRAEIRGTHAG